MMSTPAKLCFFTRQCFVCHLRTTRRYQFVIKIQSNWYSGKSQSAIFTQLSQLDRTYESMKSNFDITVPEYFNFAHDFLDQWAEVDKNDRDKPLAFWFVYKNGQEVKWTFDELTRKSKKTANALKNLGAGTKWTRCLVILPKMPEWWIINIACMRLGVILYPATSQSTSKDIEYRLNSSKAQCVFTVPKLADTIDSVTSKCPQLNTKILVDPSGNSKAGWQNFKQHFDSASDQHQCVRTKSSDTLQIFFTSGTTTLPKRVVHTHGHLPLGMFVFAKYILQLNRRRVFWNMADTGWAKTLWSSVLTPWLTGATVFVHEMPTFDVELTLTILRDYPIEVLCAPPTVYRLLIATNVPKFKSLIESFSAGEPMNPEVMKKWNEKTGLTIIEGFGQTETSALVSNLPKAKIRPGSFGKEVAGYQVAIVDDKGRKLPIGERGNIAVKVKPKRPLALFKEYEDDPVRTQKSFVGDYYLTGDRAYMDKDGYYWYDCRSDDIITSSAYRIGPFEVESAIQEHPDVLESAVIGVPDPQRTEVVKAYIILKESGKTKDPESLKKEIQEHVKNSTAPYKYPRQIEFVDKLPKTISGKIKRAELREKSAKNPQK